MKQLIDTNVLLRFLVADNPEQHKQAATWFEEAERGERQLIVESIVIAETCFVLEKFYQRERLEIAEVLQVFVSQRWLEVTQRDALKGLWPWYLKGFHFVDSFLRAQAESMGGQVLTFDKKLRSIS